MASFFVSFMDKVRVVLIVVTTLSFVNVVPISLVVVAYKVLVVLIVVTTLSFVNVVPISLVLVAYLFKRF